MPLYIMCTRWRNYTFYCDARVVGTWALIRKQTVKLQDKVALVTGAASGIGKGIVRRYVKDGATVYRSEVDSKSGEPIASEIGGAVLRLDVTIEIDWSAAIDRIGSDHGRLNVLVNNAGIVSNASICDMTLDTWNRVRAFARQEEAVWKANA